MESDILHQLSESNDRFIMACGGGTPCCTFLFNNIDYMNQAATRPVWIVCLQWKHFSRLVNQKSNVLIRFVLKLIQLRGFISKKFSDRRMYYEQAELVVDEEPVELDKLINYLSCIKVSCYCCSLERMQ